MAGNKFASMIQRNSNRITVILVYAALEWFLIILLLLNSLFSYLITKFVEYFGLKPPCLWCSRIDHVLNPTNNSNSYLNHLCEAHVAEFSQLGYCSNHRRLAQSKTMCFDCLASKPNLNNERVGMTRRIGYISWVSNDALENGGKALRCSCCNESLSRDLYPPCLLFKTSWGAALKYSQKGGSVIEAIDDESNGSECNEINKHEPLVSYDEGSFETEKHDREVNPNNEREEKGQQLLSEDMCFSLKDASEENHSKGGLDSRHNTNEAEEDQTAGTDVSSIYQSHNESVIPCRLQDYSSLEIINPERNLGFENNRMIPLELIDLSTIGNHGSYNSKAGSLKRVDHANEKSSSGGESCMEATASKVAIFLVEDNQEKTKFENFEEMMANMEKLRVIDIEEMVQDMVEEACKQVVSMKEARALSITNPSNYTGLQMNESDELSACKEKETDDITLSVDQTTAADVRKLSDRETNQFQAQEQSPPLARLTEDLSSLMAMAAEITHAPVICLAPDKLSGRFEEIIVEPRTSADKKEGGKSHLSDPNEADDEKLPETPNSVDSIHNLHKKLLVNKRETGAEESMEGSVVSEPEGGDQVLTIEKLKAALKAERKVLSSLYAELEEERNASAIAANQTMAMINRLQEEKAAVQMEALQYQRMMEEQSEYDQEALQLLNELMIKREKEKQELEKELEVYRQKFLNFETKEKTRMMRSSRSRSSSATCSNGEDIDEISVDFNREAKDFDRSSRGTEINNNNTTSGVDEVTNLQEIALDCVKHMTALDDSLAEFEEERLSILDQLKALEEKLINLNENDFIEDENSTEHSSKYCVMGLDESYELNTPEGEEDSNNLLKEKCYPDRKTMGSMVKNLLPLLDAADDDTDGFSFEDISASKPIGGENSPASNSQLETKKIAIEEEVDHVYERLQALEADREFLKHCMSSIQKGDKGMDLLQEILQHLRDLRAVELRSRDMNDDLLQQIEVENPEKERSF